MRTREQFKAYVYEKANAEMLRKKRSRNIWIRSVATCSLLLIIGGVALYSGIGVEDMAMESAPEEVNTAEKYAVYDLADGVAECEQVEIASPTADDCVYLYSSKLASASGATLEAFDFEKVEAQYGGTNAGVKGRGFKNTTEVDADDFDAVELAKNECTVEYDSYDVAYDSKNGIWRVVFYKSGTVGGDQTVYIDSDGITKLIIYGE